MWKVKQNTVEVMIIASFDKSNPFEKDYLFINMEQSELCKRILLLKPTNESNQIFSNLHNADDGSYLIVKPVTISIEQDWKSSKIDAFNKEQLLFIFEKFQLIVRDEIEDQKNSLDEHSHLPISPIPSARCASDCSMNHIRTDIRISEWLINSMNSFLHKIVIHFCCCLLPDDEYPLKVEYYQDNDLATDAFDGLLLEHSNKNKIDHDQ